MRRTFVFFVVLHLGLLTYLTWICLPLIDLLFEHDSANDLGATAFLHSGEDWPAERVADAVALIPKIIHQTFKTEDLPIAWRAAQRTCIDLHPDYVYMFWTDETARAFISDDYSWFLPTFDAYPEPIQRADAFRYMVLARFGGIYIDVDVGCNRRLDPLLALPAFAHRTWPTGISNDVIGSVPSHPFFLAVVAALQSYNRNLLSPYITVMGTTGPMFLSIMWRKYLASGTDKGAAALWLLSSEVYNEQTSSFFVPGNGSSWHRADAETIDWMGKHALTVALIGVALGSGLLLAWWKLWVWLASAHFRRLSSLYLGAPRYTPVISREV